jgi:hypothetical protein
MYTINSARYHQMLNSDGKATHAILDGSSQLLPYSSPGWVSVHSEVGLTNDNTVTQVPVAGTFRYVRVGLRNSGAFGNAGYVELERFELCGGDNPPTAYPTTRPPTTAAPTDYPTTMAPTHGYGTSGDPFTTDAQGNKVQFFLPLQLEQHLLACHDMQLYGRSMSSGIAGDHQQWFDQFRLTVAGAEMLKIEVSKKDKLLVPVGAKVSDDVDVSRGSGNWTKATQQNKQPLTTISVAVMKEAMPRTGVIAYNGVEVDVSRNEAKRIGEGYSEVVDVVVGSTHLQFTSAAAAKFASKTEQALYSHLDVRFAALDAKTCTAGILAEIWGMAKMSAATAAMLQPAA